MFWRQRAPPQSSDAARVAMNNFEMQAIISLSVMTFSMGMLASGRGEPAAYLPVVTSVMAYWLPSPMSKKRSD